MLFALPNTYNIVMLLQVTQSANKQTNRRFMT